MLKSTAFLFSALLPLSLCAAQEPPKAQAVFDVLKGLQGTWQGESKSGLKERLEAKLIAQGSVLMETSSLGMATMYHRDGERVLLTHYCMAKNQPRLRASEISADGKRITFTFLDGTNLASRDVGHMDKVVMQILDRDTYRAQWTWFEKGKEAWMEDVTFRRVKPSKPKRKS